MCPSSLFCLSVCSPAVVAPCRPPSVWIVCLLLRLTTIAIKTSTLLHSFPSALETLTLHPPSPLRSFPLLHSAYRLYNVPITFLPILSLNYLIFKISHSARALSLSTAVNSNSNLNPEPACPSSQRLTSTVLTAVQRACRMAAAPTIQIPLLKATCSVHPSPSRTTHSPIPGTAPHSFPSLVLTLTLCPTACQTCVPTPSKTFSPRQIQILKACCCAVFTGAAKLIPVPQDNLTLTPSANPLLCSHVGGPRWSLRPPSQSPLTTLSIHTVGC